MKYPKHVQVIEGAFHNFNRQLSVRTVVAIDNHPCSAIICVMDIAKFLIIWHSRTGASEAMARAAFDGARQVADADCPPNMALEIELLAAEMVEAEKLLAATAYLFVCPENLANMSGVMKDMFDRCYYPVLGHIEGRVYATMIAAGSDGEGAERQIDRIVTGWRLRRVADSVIINLAAQEPEEILAPKNLSINQINKCTEVGTAMAEGITLRIF